ncbi:MAG: hypothetical protein C0187_05635 [Calditerrivibrio nitroreducens]|uniref:Uncharacterized protein n=1 Tax=Calditerrivibrio nitroreducens TaxID=477976 RepID=A0A2J6WIV0_9BACT|nr:MAG: hypothetical protein C0187_05635 [Calditerrivibrio nitroreducens]
MKKSLVGFVLMLLTSLSYADDLDNFLMNLNMQIGNDKTSFEADLSTTFGSNEMKVKSVVGSVDKPADAYMVFRLAEVTKKQPEEVLLVYKKHKEKGWGKVAQELGVKPGSREFHELKENKLKNHGKKGKEKKEHKKGKDRD